MHIKTSQSIYKRNMAVSFHHRTASYKKKHIRILCVCLCVCKRRRKVGEFFLVKKKEEHFTKVILVYLQSELFFFWLMNKLWFIKEKTLVLNCKITFLNVYKLHKKSFWIANLFKITGMYEDFPIKKVFCHVTLWWFYNNF